MSKRTVILVGELQRKTAMQYLVDAPLGYVMTLQEATKRRIQEERYHAMIGDIAKQCDYNGRRLDAESWKRLLVEAFVHILREEARAQDKPDPFPRGGALLPSLDGMRIVQVEVLTRTFTVRQASDFIEHLFAFGTDRSVVWSEPKEVAYA